MDPTQNLGDSNLNHFFSTHNSQDDDNFNFSSNINAVEERFTLYENTSHVSHVTYQHHDNADINTQPMVSSQSLTPLVTSTTSFQEIMVEHSFFYRPCNDFQIYHIICKELTFEELIYQLLNNNYFHSNEIFVFYFQQPSDKRIYQITCEMVSHSVIVQFLNLNIYGIEINQTEQHIEFSSRHKENLEFHLKQFLFSYLHR